MTLYPLAMHPWPVKPEHLALIKRAKAELALDFQIIPVEAVPGGPVRVLALGSLPPFLCLAARVFDPNNYLSVLNGLRWCLCDGDESHGFGFTDYLTAIFGSNVEEVFDGEDGTGMVAGGQVGRIGDHQGAQQRVTFR